MCGIVYAQNFNGEPVNNDIMQIFDNQRHRGTEGFGLFDGQEMNMVHATKEDKILKWLVKYNSNLVLFHHRYPSSTINVKRAAHPFSTHKFFGDTQYVLVHNGHINNAYSLQEEHAEMGIDYHSILQDGTFNDTEALLWDLALTLEGHQEKLRAAGQIAFVCLKIVKGKLQTMYFGRNISPLKMVRSKKEFRLASEGEGEMIAPDTLFTYNYALKRLTQKHFTIPDYVATQYSSHTWEEDEDDYTPKGTAGDWLPSWLRSKYRSEIDNICTGNVESAPQFVDYDKDGNPIFEEDEYTRRAKRENRLLLPDGTMSGKEAVDEVEAYQMAFDYLVQADGNFEQAYSLAESDYELMFDVPEKYQDDDYFKQVKVMEQVLQEINSDPEYIDENSVSSTWLPLTQQMLHV